MNKAVIYILVSVVCFAIVNVFVKTLIIQGIPSSELVFFRSLVSITFCIVLVRKLKLPLLGVNKKWLFIRGISGTVALYLFFLTLKSLPLAIATTLQYLSPIFTVIFAIWLNDQKVKPLQWLFFGVAFSGVVFMKLEDILKSTEQIVLLPYLFGILSALISGLAYNAIIKCKTTDHPITIVMYFPLIAIPVMGIYMIPEFVLPKGIQWFYIIILGSFTQLAQVYMTKAWTTEKASVVAPFKYVGSIFAISFGMIFFGEILSIWALSGIAILILGVLLNLRFEKSIRN